MVCNGILLCYFVLFFCRNKLKEYYKYSIHIALEAHQAHEIVDSKDDHIDTSDTTFCIVSQEHRVTVI